jgi:hypothetical protein
MNLMLHLSSISSQPRQVETGDCRKIAIELIYASNNMWGVEHVDLVSSHFSCILVTFQWSSFREQSTSLAPSN